MVLIGGDLVDESIEKVKSFLLPLNNLKSTHGTFYVPGNHEYYHGIEPILSFLDTLNLTILGNECVHLGGSICAACMIISQGSVKILPLILTKL